MSSARKSSCNSKLCSLKQLGLPTSVTLALISVVFAALVYLWSFFIFHLSPSSLSLDTFPLYLALDPHARSLDKPLALTNASEKGVFALEQRKFNVQVSVDGESQVDKSPSSDAELEGLDLGEILKLLAPEQRQNWLKLHWSGVKFLNSDGISQQFSTRLKSFFRSRKCSHQFFMTWISPLSSFGRREILCIESIFKVHPSACLVILSRSLDTRQGRHILQPFLQHGYHVMAASPHLPFLFNDTPAQFWLKEVRKGRVDPGEIAFPQNLSNILRLVVLYKYGGIYLDSDIIVLKDLSNLSNCIGAQSEDPHTAEWNRLNNAVLVFDKRHQLLRSFIQEFAKTFNGSKWGHNGPYLATRVMRRLQHRGGCNCTIMPSRAFYPVIWRHIPRFFKSPQGERDVQWWQAKLQQLLNESYTLHLWNKQTGETEIENGSIIDELFRRQCIFCGPNDSQLS